MKTILASLFAVSLLATIAHADVLIYRGVNKITADAQVAALFNKPPNVYLAVDFDTGKVGTILYGRIGGLKRFVPSGPSDLRLKTVLFPTKFETIVATGFARDNGPSDTPFGITIYRGGNTDLLIRKTPAHTTLSKPNVLRGTIFDTSGGDNRYIEQQMALTFQGAATIKANNANQTIDQAIADLVAGLMAKGFVSL